MTRPRAPGPEPALGISEAGRLFCRRYFLWGRLAVRVLEAAIVALGPAPDLPWIPLAAGCALLDLSLAAALRRDRPPRWVRLILDGCDVALWSLVIGPPADAAALVAAPLACEAGMGSDWFAPAVPAVVAAITTAVLLAAGRTPEAAPFLWPGAAALCSALAARYLAGQAERWRRRTRAELEAETGRAALAGQSSIALGADTVLDLITRTAPLLSLAGRPPMPPLTVWRMALARAGTGRVTYLGVALASWQRRRNAGHDLSADVEVRCTGDAGTQLLSPRQVEQLTRALDAMPLRGEVTVELLRGGRPGAELRLRVSVRRLTLPPDPRPGPPPLDPGPLAFVVGAMAALAHSLPSFEAVPLLFTLPPAGAALALVWLTHRWLATRGPEGRPAVLAAALALGTADAVLSTLGMRNLATDHLVRLPSLLFLIWFGPLVVLYWRDLTTAQRLMAPTAAATAATAGILLLPHPVAWPQLLSAPLWPLTALLIALGVREVLDRDAERARIELERRRRRAAERSYRRGRRLVLRLVAGAHRDLRREFRVVRQRLRRPVAEEVERRLDEIGRRLRALRAEERAHARGRRNRRPGSESTIPLARPAIWQGGRGRAGDPGTAGSGHNRTFRASGLPEWASGSTGRSPARPGDAIDPRAGSCGEPGPGVSVAAPLMRGGATAPSGGRRTQPRG